MEFYREKFIEFMKDKKISQGKLAKLIGVSQPAVGSWINGYRIPKERNIMLMAKVLKVPVSEISDLDEVKDISEEVSGYFQGWGTSLNKDKMELDDPCIRAIEEIENIKSEQYRLRTVTRAFMTTMQSMLYVKNYFGKYIVANESYLKAIGLNVNINIIGKKDHDFLSQRIAAGNDTEDMSIINTGKPLINQSVKFPFPNSSIKWCVMTKVPLRDNKQNIVGMVASFTDITEARKLQKQEKLLNDIIKSSSAALSVLSVVDGKRKFIYANEAFEEILGYTKQDFIEDILCWIKNVSNADTAKIDNYINADPEYNQKSVSFWYSDPNTKEEKYLTFKTSVVKGSDYRFHSIYDDTVKRNEELERKKLFKSFKLLAGFIDNINSAVFISEFVDNEKRLRYVYRNRKSYDYIDDKKTLRDVYDPRQHDEILKREKSNEYPRTLRYNIIKNDVGICTIEEKIWLQEIEGTRYIFSVINDIPFQKNVEIIFDKDIKL